MCRSSSEPGGPRRCSGDTRDAYERATTTVTQLQSSRTQLLVTVGDRIRETVAEGEKPDRDLPFDPRWVPATELQLDDMDIDELEGLSADLEDTLCGHYFNDDEWSALTVLESAVHARIAEALRGAESQWAVTASRHRWKLIGEGNYGQVYLSPDGNRAVKELLRGRRFGPHEVELATRMGELGHSPRVFSSTETALEMEIAPGTTLWADYARAEDEPVMTAAQAAKVAAALHDLHKMGYAHGDLHALQFRVDGDNVKMLDYGLSVPHSERPVKALHDLNKIRSLVFWENPELEAVPYVRLVNKHLGAYREVTGQSKAAVAQRDEIAKAYLKELEEL